MVTATTPFVRASNLIGRPVVTTGGEADLEVQDLVVGDDGRTISGLTLRRPGILGKRHVGVLATDDITSIGSDAVMVADGQAFGPDERELAVGHDLTGRRVITTDGTAIGTVRDVIVETRRGRSRIEGVELVVEPGVGDEAHALLALGTDATVSAEMIVVRSGAVDDLCTDPEALVDSVTQLRSRKASS